MEYKRIISGIGPAGDLHAGHCPAPVNDIPQQCCERVAGESVAAVAGGCPAMRLAT